MALGRVWPMVRGDGRWKGRVVTSKHQHGRPLLLGATVGLFQSQPGLSGRARATPPRVARGLLAVPTGLSWCHQGLCRARAAPPRATRGPLTEPPGVNKHGRPPGRPWASVGAAGAFSQARAAPPRATRGPLAEPTEPLTEPPGHLAWHEPPRPGRLVGLFRSHPPLCLSR